MTKGRRGEKTYTGFNGAATDVLRAKDKLRSQNAGSTERVVAPSQEAVRMALEDGVCPFCPAGPFQLLGGHICRAHGYSADEMKDMAGFLKSRPLCTPELSETLRRANGERRLPDSAYDGRAGRVKRQFTQAGLAIQREKLEKARQDWAPTAGAASQAQYAARIRAERIASEWPAFDAEVIRRYRRGELIAEIANALGVSKPKVSRSLKRSGVAGDQRGRASRGGRKAFAREAMSAARAERERAIAGQRVDRFIALGADWAAVHDLAHEERVTAKSLRDWLVKHGWKIDGRSQTVVREVEQ